jgi:hypothetical protein
MKDYILLIAIFIATLSAYGQQQPQCTADTLYRLMDFWVGEWDVFDDRDTLVGHNVIEKILSDCAVTEHWTGAGGGQGMSLFYIDNDTREWRQVWVTGSARQPWGQKEKRLVHAEPGHLIIFQGSYQYQGAPLLDRTLLQKRSDTSVLQTIQVSQDGGQNWRTTFTGHYRRRTK